MDAADHAALKVQRSLLCTLPRRVATVEGEVVGAPGLRRGHSHRNTLDESATHTMNTRTSAATSPRCANQLSPRQIP